MVVYTLVMGIVVHPNDPDLAERHTKLIRFVRRTFQTKAIRSPSVSFVNSFVVHVVDSFGPHFVIAFIIRPPIKTVTRRISDPYHHQVAMTWVALLFEFWLINSRQLSISFCIICCSDPTLGTLYRP